MGYPGLPGSNGKNGQPVGKLFVKYYNTFRILTLSVGFIVVKVIEMLSQTSL